MHDMKTRGVRSLGFRTDLMLRTMAGSVIVDHETHHVIRTPGNPTFWWGNFILHDAPPQPHDLPRWLAGFTAEFPDAGHVALGVDGTDGDTGDVAALTDLGLTVEVNTVLTAHRLRPAAPAADDTPVIRPLDGDDDWRQATELRLTCYYDAPSPDEQRFTELQVADERRLCDAGHGTWFGSFPDGHLRAGGGVFTDGGGLARFQSIETHPGFRRRGLASAVIRHAGDWALQRAHVHTLVIVADPDDDAIRLYRALGFAETEHQVQLYRG